MIKSAWLFFLLIGCSSFPKFKLPKSVQKTPPSYFESLGAIEIERSPKIERGPTIGTFTAPLMFSATDLFVGTLGGTFGRFNTTTGSFRWKHTFQIGIGSRPVVQGTHVYVGAMDGFVYAYDARDGTQIWKKRLSAESLGNLVIAPKFLYVATADNVLWALDIESGKELWTLRRPSPNASYYWSLRGNTAGVLSLDQKSLFVGFSDGVVVGLNAETGVTKWERSFSRPGRYQDADSEPILAVDGQTLFLALPDHSVQLLRTGDGLSTDSFPDSNGFLPLVDAKEGSVTYATQNGSVRKYMLNTKRLVWETFIDRKGFAGDIVGLGDGTAITTSTRYGAHLIDLKTGVILDDKYLGEGIIARPVSDGTRVFIMTGRGRLVLLRIRKHSA